VEQRSIVESARAATFALLGPPLAFGLSVYVAGLLFGTRSSWLHLIGILMVFGGTQALALWPNSVRELGKPQAEVSATVVDWGIPLAPSLLFAGIFLLEPPIEYFMVVRTSITVVALALLIRGALRDHHTVYAWLLGLVAVLFNPILPVYLHDRDAWLLIDVVAIGVLWSATFRFRSVLPS
jgi:hypothetical protein